jgi:predicted nucleotidyltransferase component of viral defense system
MSDFQTIYFRQAELLMHVIPHIAPEKNFALKGGTALNFYVNDMPRLSVDIDLAFLPLMSRDETFQNINSGIRRIIERLQKSFPEAVFVRKSLSEGISPSFQMTVNDITVKVETNFNFRGSVFDPEVRELSEKAQKIFKLHNAIQTLSVPELWAGKICAALDRQHPRDLFDIRELESKSGFTEEIRKAFIVYLISHNRPMIELLNPQFRDIESDFRGEFQGMTLKACTLSDLEDARLHLVQWVSESLTLAERRFILSVKEISPQWDLVPELAHVRELPSLRWKMLNLSKMKKSKHLQAVNKLRRWLQV